MLAAQNLNSYSLTDNHLPNVKNVFYRLKMVDINGRFNYSRTVSARLNSIISDAVIYPNPTKGSITILLKKALSAKSILVVSDIAGRIIAEQIVNATQTTIALNMEHLAPGRYFMSIKNNTETIKQSFVIIK